MQPMNGCIIKRMSFNKELLMSSVKRIMSSVFLVLSCYAAQSRTDVLSQDEIDSIVDTQLLMFEHDDDFQAAEKALIDRGVTKSMLAHGYYASLVKSMNADRGSLGAQKFQAALYGYVESVDETQMTNLLAIASASVNQRSVVKIIRSYHARYPHSNTFIKWSSKKFFMPDCQPQIRYEIMSCFESSLRNPNAPISLKAEIISCAHKASSMDPLTILVADRILCNHEEGYESSVSRKQIISRIKNLRGDTVPKSVLMRFNLIPKKEEEK